MGNLLCNLLFSFLLTLGFIFALPTSTQASVYGGGTYGSCQYESCGIALSSSSTVALDVTPSGGSATCSVSDDTVSVTTHSSTGYTVTLSHAESDSHLVNMNNDFISSVNGTTASPQPITANTWGYRVDGLGSFGEGPTESQNSSSVPNELYSEVPSSVASPATIITSNSPAPDPVSTSVWYGLCVDITQESGTYTGEVMYTAYTN